MRQIYSWTCMLGGSFLLMLGGAFTALGMGIGRVLLGTSLLGMSIGWWIARQATRDCGEITDTIDDEELSAELPAALRYGWRYCIPLQMTHVLDGSSAFHRGRSGRVLSEVRIASTCFCSGSSQKAEKT